MTLQTPAGVDAAATASLHRLILGLADSKRILGIRYSDWLLGAPSVEDGIAASSMAQDEWGHARLLYAMLKEFGIDPVEVEHERPASDYRSLDALDESFDDWAEVTVAMVIVDGALSALLEAFAEGSFESARGRVPKMLSEEAFHADLGSAWFRRLAKGTDEARERLVGAVERFLPRVLAWIEPADEIASVLAGQGLFRADPSPAAQFRERIAPLLSLIGLDAHAIEADRSGWDEERGRGPGAPADEAVERARGDLNRALFVE